MTVQGENASTDTAEVDVELVSAEPIRTKSVNSTTSEDESVTVWPWLLVALLAHTGWGIYPVLGRYMQTVSGLPSMSLLAVGSAPMLIALCIYVLPRHGVAPLRSRALWMLMAFGVARSITNILAVRFTLAIYVQLITLMTPFVIASLNYLILRERIPRYTGRATALSFIGVLLMMSDNIGEGQLGQASAVLALSNSDWLGIALAFSSSLFLALYMIAVRNTARQQLSGIVVLVYQSVVISCVALVSSLLVGEEWSRWLTLGPRDWLVVGAFMLIVVVGANGLQIGALRKIGAPMVSSLMAWRLVATLAVANFMLNERLTSVWQLIGAAVVLCTVSWYLWRQRQKRQR